MAYARVRIQQYCRYIRANAVRPYEYMVFLPRPSPFYVDTTLEPTGYHLPVQARLIDVILLVCRFIDRKGGFHKCSGVIAPVAF